MAADSKTAQAMRDELTDVLLYTVRLASILKMDLDSAVQEKFEANAAKYPVGKSHGSSSKYTEL
jgi:dCTP diphosphatase